MPDGPAFCKSMTGLSLTGMARASAFCISVFVLASCSSEQDTRHSERVVQETVEITSGSLDSDSQSDLFYGRGKVVKVIASGSFIELDHGDIPDYMSAMSMLFPVADTSIIHGIAVDDSVRFQISGDGALLQISRIGF